MPRAGRSLGAAVLVAAVLAACGGASDSPDDAGVPSSTSQTPSQLPGAPSVTGTVASGLAVPWGIAFLPDLSLIHI